MIRYVVTFQNDNLLQAQLFEEKEDLSRWLTSVAEKQDIRFDTIRIFYALSESKAEAKVSVKIKIKDMKSEENIPPKITQPKVDFNQQE